MNMKKYFLLTLSLPLLLLSSVAQATAEPANKAKLFRELKKAVRAEAALAEKMARRSLADQAKTMKTNPSVQMCKAQSHEGIQHSCLDALKAIVFASVYAYYERDIDIIMSELSELELSQAERIALRRAQDASKLTAQPEDELPESSFMMKYQSCVDSVQRQAKEMFPDSASESANAALIESMQILGGIQCSDPTNRYVPKTFAEINYETVLNTDRVVREETQTHLTNIERAKQLYPEFFK